MSKYLLLISRQIEAESLLQAYSEGEDDKFTSFVVVLDHMNTHHMPEELSRSIAEAYLKAMAFDKGFSSDHFYYHIYSESDMDDEEFGCQIISDNEKVVIL